MDEMNGNRKYPKPHVQQSYEDPHYHDDELEIGDENHVKTIRSPQRKAVRRIPPPPRRPREE